MSISIRLARTKKDIAAVLKIREIVFIKGQDVPADMERDGFDEKATHVIVLSRGKPVGCARIRFKGTKAKLERIAILQSQRGKGLGKRLVKYLVSYCKRRGVKEVVMGAQYYLKKFYKDAGFTPRGKKFKEAGIEHVEMYLRF